jgi:putative aminopeptidase FrvX
MLRQLSAMLVLCVAASSQDHIPQLMKQLTEAPGPPGAEGPVRELMVENMKPYADKILYDGLGSVIAQQGSSGPRIMVDAHMDELGGMVRHIRDDGYISVQMLGYWLEQALGDQRWVILGSRGPVLAVSELWDAHVEGTARFRPNIISTWGPGTRPT